MEFFWDWYTQLDQGNKLIDIWSGSRGVWNQINSSRASKIWGKVFVRKKIVQNCKICSSSNHRKGWVPPSVIKPNFHICIKVNSKTWKDWQRLILMVMFTCCLVNSSTYSDAMETFNRARGVISCRGSWPHCPGVHNVHSFRTSLCPGTLAGKEVGALSVCLLA